ncbi:MAG: acetyl-CoA C-acetyltransferase [Granulosicoccaceae bacterium]
MQEAVIVEALRSPIGKFQGALSGLPASDMGGQVIRALIQRSGIDPALIDDVILGQVLCAGEGQNPARQASIAAGLPHSVPALTINRVCGSGLEAIALARQAIRSGDADAIIAGGQENMSAALHALPHSRTGQRMGNWQMIDTMITDGLWCAINNYHMGQTAENVAEQFSISREEQDAFALASQQKAAAAKFDGEIVSIEVPQRRGSPLHITTDEYPKPDTDASVLEGLKSAFVRDGTVTAANASGINDGAAAVLVMSEAKAQALGLKPLAKIRSSAVAGVDPAIMGTGPIPAVTRCLEKAGWKMSELDLIESNEAFAAQSLAVVKELGLPKDRLNVNGGAIALGHPIGASGARILVTLLHEMKRRQVQKGLATLCVGGGQGVALAVEAM